MPGAFGNWRKVIPLFYDTYQNILNNPHAHSYIGCCNTLPVCQVDLYCIVADELKKYINYNIDDCGIHLLMLPPEKRSKDWHLLC